ncbi:MAG: efflux RND transporter permease subunit, partial [Spirochaetales bacterium]|nr:efflux RND transporter permease subunit [Spirochaetales bacterium]
MSISTFSAKNPVFINILMITLFVLGFFSLQRLPREQFAEVPFFWVNITVPFPGAGAEDVEQLVTIPIEDEMSGLKNVEEIQSTSSEGISVVSVRFESTISQETFDTLFQDVATRFSRVLLPDGVLKERIDAFSSNDFTPVIELVLSGDVEYASLVLAAEDMAKEIQRVADVSEAELIGVREREILIEVNQKRLGSAGVTLDEIVQALRVRNLNIPGGNVKTPTREYLVRTTGELEKIDDFSGVIIRRASGSSGVLYVRDVASVQETYKDEGSIARFDGRPAATIRVSKVPKGNSIQIAADVNKIVEKWENKLSDEINISVLNDSTVQIRKSLDVLLSNAVLGLILLVIILYFFIGLRNSLMTALGIPLTFAMTVIVLDIMGETFNSNTLFGMVLVLGLIVDHAIVIIENSYRLQQEGLSRHEAAVKGADQVIWPVIAATGTTVAAFLPLMILPGTIGRFLRVIPLTVTIALVASTFEALFFLPSHYADWPGKDHDEGKGRFFRTVRNGYEQLLKKLYRIKGRTVAAAVVIIIAVLSLTATLRQDLFSAEDFRVFYINITLPVGTSSERTDEVVGRYEQRLLPLVGNGEITAISSSIGFLASGSGNTRQGNVAQILVDLAEEGTGGLRPVAEIMAEVKAITEDIPGPDKVFFRKAVNGPPQDPPVSFRLFGDNLEGLATVAQAIREGLAGYPELLNINDDLSGGKPELKIVVNEERAAAYGLNVLSIGQYIRAAVSGVEATTYVRNNTAVDVRVTFMRSGRFSADEVVQLYIPTRDGREIPFSAVADVVTDESPSTINRVDGRRV